jgi:LysM repeat protein
MKIFEKMTRLFLSAIVLAACAAASYGQNIYLQFDESCLTRMEYASGSSSSPYVAYSYDSGNNAKMFVEVGTEDAKWVKELPVNTVTCSGFRADKELVRKINDGAIGLFIVRKSPTHFHAAKVDKATWIEKGWNSFSFTSYDADFDFSPDDLKSGVNMAKTGSKTAVYVDGTLKVQCLSGYIFQKKENGSSSGYKEFVFIPQVGIVEKRSVSENNGDVNALKLNKLGNTDYKNYVSAACDKLQADYYDASPADATPASYDDLTPKSGVPAAYNSDPCAPSAVQGIHVVQKGETMYGLSKRYGITLDQLRSWNSLQGTDVLSLCQRIYVKQPSSVSQPSGETTTEKGDGTSTPTTKPESGYWISAPEVHVVRPGETVAMLANMYGYTEERFRKMNSLSPYERITSGQRLHTSDCVCPTLESTTKGQPLPYSAEDQRITTAAPAEKGATDDVYYRPVKIHHVKGNETLFSIARQYNTTVERIMELNGMKKGEGVKQDMRIYVQ